MESFLEEKNDFLMKLDTFETVENIEMLKPRSVLKYANEKTMPQLLVTFKCCSSTII